MPFGHVNDGQVLRIFFNFQTFVKKNPYNQGGIFSHFDFYFELGTITFFGDISEVAGFTKLLGTGQTSTCRNFNQVGSHIFRFFGLYKISNCRVHKRVRYHQKNFARTFEPL